MTFTGPRTDGVCTIQRTISTQSSRCTHDMYWRPDPSGPPAKNRNGRIISRQRAAAALEDDARADQDDARQARGLARLLLPVDAQLRQEVVARSIALGQRLGCRSGP